MPKEKPNLRLKIVHRILIGGIVLGIIGFVLRVILTFLGALAIPFVMGGRLFLQSPNEILAVSIIVLNIVTPYLIGLGAASIFLYVFLFPDKESRGVLVGWGILMTVYVIAKIFIIWL